MKTAFWGIGGSKPEHLPTKYSGYKSHFGITTPLKEKGG